MDNKTKEQNKKKLSKKNIEDQVIEALKNIFDPEIPVNIYDLGLIYEVKVDDDFNVEIVMTLTSPSCPVAESLPNEIQEKVNTLWSIKSSKITLTWEPPWDKEMISEEAKLELGLM